MLSPPQTVFAVLHIADFALHAVLRTERDAAGRPAALFASPGKRSIVLAANPAARAFGVEPGLTGPQAAARCPTLLIRAPYAEAEAEARAALLATGFTLSPTIEETAPGVCTADLKGGDRENLSPPVQAAVAELHRLGLPATAGIAATPLLALYAARSALNQTPVLHITDPASFLTPLPLAAADPTTELADVLRHWGLRTLGDLTALPRDDIVQRFGTEGLALWNRAAGGASRPLHPVAPPQSFAAEMEFDQEIETLEPLLFILRRFLDRLALELLASHYVAAELELTLQLEDQTAYARRFRLPEPTADADILFRALHTHLESLQTGASISAVQLRITPARPLVRQQGLFDTGLRDPHGFAETLARVVALVGSDRVGTPQTQDTHRPDSVKLVAPASVIPPLAAPPVHATLSPPLRRFRPPLPAQVELTAGRATYLWTERVHGEISVQSDAWPSSGDWWQTDRAWQRLEWDIVLAEGGLYRLLRIGQTYFLEGEYD
ncbi:MAG: DNA polymerase Y family protein [Opitutus sp.]|nr:DNA polymerase Y family protein [Opitutus sp.]